MSWCGASAALSPAEAEPHPTRRALALTVPLWYSGGMSRSSSIRASIPPQLHEALRAEAERRRLSLSWLVWQILADWLEAQK